MTAEHGGSPTAFDGLVDAYDAARPGYPPALLDLLPPLEGRVVLEVGAGTGKASRVLAGAGARLVLTDLGPRMLARAHEHLPAAPAVVARAEQLPVRAHSVDLVTAAQAWHWVDVPRATAEVARVLRPGGALCVWWNEPAADGLAWFDAQQSRLEAANPRYRRGYRDRPYGDELVATGRFATVTRAEVAWERTLDLDTYELWLRSKSYVDAIREPARSSFLAAERASLQAGFPDGEVREAFTLRVWVALLADRVDRG